MSADRLFFPERTLRRSELSETGAILYSAPLGSQHGRGKHFGIYIEPWALPDPPPSEVHFMLYTEFAAELIERDRRAKSASDGIVTSLKREKPHDDTTRFVETASHGIRSIYFPKRDVSALAGSDVVVHVYWNSGSRVVK